MFSLLDDITEKDPTGPVTNVTEVVKKSSYEERKFSFAILYFYIVVLFLVLSFWGYQRFMKSRQMKNSSIGRQSVAL